MGSKHPISLRLKTKENWVNTSYHFCSGNELHNYFGIDKIALNVIKHYFQFAILSKPKLPLILAFIVILLILFFGLYRFILKIYQYSYDISTFVFVMKYITMLKLKKILI